MIAQSWLLAAEAAGSPTSLDEFQTFRETVVKNLSDHQMMVGWIYPKYLNLAKKEYRNFLYNCCLKILNIEECFLLLKREKRLQSKSTKRNMPLQKHCLLKLLDLLLTPFP